MNLDNTISELSMLPVEERLRVVQAVWDSLPMDPSVKLTAAQHAELNRRMAAHDADPSTSLTRDELERRLQDDD